MIKYFVVVICVCLLLSACVKQPVQVTTLQQLCPNYNPVFIEHHGNDSAMYFIPNCFAPGDSTSPNDSLVEFGKNLAQVVVYITDTASGVGNILCYSNQTFQTPGFVSRTVWYGNSGYFATDEGCYFLTVTGTTLYGTTFSIKGTVSLLRFFFGNDLATTGAQLLVNCDTCTFNSQWNGTNVNLQLPTNEHFVPDNFHVCN